ncbi:unnamed protein product [Calypogeia fissa]
MALGMAFKLNVVSTDAAATDYGYGRRMRDPAAELEGSLARYRHLITNHEEFASMRNLLQEDKKKTSEQHEANEQNLISSHENTSVEEKPQIMNYLDFEHEGPDISSYEFQRWHHLMVQQGAAKIAANIESQEKHKRDKKETFKEDSKTQKKEENHKSWQKDNSSNSEKNNSKVEKEQEEATVLPEPYLLGAIIKDWDGQRESWFKANPKMRAKPDGKPRVLIVTGSQPEPCKASQGDSFHIKSLKLKIDYARMHNYELYYNLAFLDPLFDSFWVKVPTIRTLMLSHPEIEWFFWVDSDAIFTDMLFEPPWKTYDGYNMIMWGINDYFYAEKSWTAFNAGVFMIRNCQWSLDLIDKWSPMGPQGQTRFLYGKILSKFLKGRNDWPSDDQSALAYLMITDEAVKAKVKLVDSPDYMISGWWEAIVDSYEDLMEKYHPGFGNHRWPWITHFTGCGPCYHSDDDNPTAKRCNKDIDRAFNFADNQVLAYMGFQHQSLSSSEVVRVRNETDRPLEYVGVNPWAKRIAELAGMSSS